MRLRHLYGTGRKSDCGAWKSADDANWRFATFTPALQPWYVKRLTIILSLLGLVIPALAQRADVSVVGGGGFAGGEEQDTHGVSAVGATLGFPYTGRHRVQFDYLFNNAYLNDSAKRHFIIGSYVIQGSVGRTRPFLQIGAGIAHRTFQGYRVVGATKTLWFDEKDTSFAVLFGGGATIDVGKSFFIRPQVRLYGHVGPTLTLLPSVGFGWRF